MEIPNAIALAGIIVSLATFCLLLCHAVSSQRRSQVDHVSSSLPKAPIRTLAPLPNTSFTRTGSSHEGVWSSFRGPSDIRLAAISRDHGCRAHLKEMAEFYGWDLFLCADCPEAESVLAAEHVPIVICDHERLHISWHDAIRLFLASDPSRCIILCSKADNDYLWHEVIGCGGYDVIRKPLREEQVVQTVNFAWSFWKVVHRRSTVNRNLSITQTSAKAI
jgi:AmiR/NasT family two-component response regulator